MPLRVGDKDAAVMHLTLINGARLLIDLTARWRQLCRLTDDKSCMQIASYVMVMRRKPAAPRSVSSLVKHEFHT